MSSEDSSSDLKGNLLLKVASGFLSHDSEATALLPHEVMDLILRHINLPLEVTRLDQAIRVLGDDRLLALEMHDGAIQALTPLLLNRSMIVRTTVANCLLRYISTAPRPVVDTRHQEIIEATAKSLAPLQFRDLDRQALRSVATTLRMLNALFIKNPPIVSDLSKFAVTCLSTWIYRQTVRAGTASPLPERGRPAMSLTQGVMSAFMAPVKPRRHTRTSSQSSALSSSSTLGSDSEEESSETERTAKLNDQVQIAALACLISLARIASKQLYQHWHLFVSDSPYTRSRPSLLNLIERAPSATVRLRACIALTQLLEDSAAYLALSEDRPSKSSYTSLSHRVGSTVVELNTQILSTISCGTVQRDSKLLSTVLNLVEVLGQNSPYHRLSRPLSQPLVAALEPYISGSSDPSVQIAAIKALTAVINSTTSHVKAGHSVPLDVSAAISAAVATLSEGHSASETILWHLLAVSAGQVKPEQLNDLVKVLSSPRADSALVVEKARLFFVTSYLAQGTSDVALNPDIETLQRLHNVVKDALKGGDTQSRISACTALSCNRSLASGDQLEHLRLLGTALRHDEPSVRSAAARGQGLIVKALAKPSVETVVTVSTQLIELCFDEESVAASASWAFANCCDKLRDQYSAIPDQLLTTTLKLSSPGTAEKVRLNGLRALGSLIRISDNLESQTEAQAVDLLRASLVSGPVKCRWNAAAAIANALSTFTANRLSATSESQGLGKSSRDTLVRAASQNLLKDACGNYKVRIQAAHAVLAGLEATTSSQRFATSSPLQPPPTTTKMASHDQGSSDPPADAGDSDARGEFLSEIEERIILARAQVEEEHDTVSTKEESHLLQLREKLALCAEMIAALKSPGDESICMQ